MNTHILVKHAKRKPYSSAPTMPTGAFYDTQKGYWINNQLPLVSPDSDWGDKVTKKCDQETGEDQKGE